MFSGSVEDFVTNQRGKSEIVRSESGQGFCVDAWGKGLVEVASASSGAQLAIARMVLYELAG